MLAHQCFVDIAIHKMECSGCNIFLEGSEWRIFMKRDWKDFCIGLLCNKIEIIKSGLKTL